MNLGGLFQYGTNTSTSSTNHINTGNQTNTAAANSAKQSLTSLTPGQTLQGEVIGRNGSEVQILVDNEVVITARLDQNVNVPMGQSLTFEVKNNSGTQIALRPVYENTAQNANVIRALDAARLPATQELMQMVSAMMKEGMSIDKNSLLEMSRMIAANTGAKPETIVQLKGLQLPVTAENIQQFENYQRYEHQLLGNVKNILAELPQAYQSLLSNSGTGQAAVDFYSQVLQLFTGTQPAVSQGETVPGGQTVFVDIVGNPGTDGHPAPLPGSFQEAVVQTKGQMAESLNGLMDSVLQETGEGKGQVIQLPEGSLHELLDAGGRNQLINLMGRLGFSEGQLTQLQDGSMTAKQFLQQLQLLLQTEGSSLDKNTLQQLFGSKEYNQILQKEIWNQWTMQPQDVGSKQKVEEFYGRLREQAARLTEALGQTGKDMPLAKSLSTMQSNMDFMHQVNQFFNYVQLPLKMSGGEAHGDLYVYTNRRGKAREDGSVSALLHLDMEHLGTMDIHVQMKDKKVNTRFYLANESIIDFIGENIHILNERLTKRGYTLDAQMLPADSGQESTSVMETITAQEHKANLLAQYSFDVRA
ncbi:MAG: flagellar hook-length control protein FliK [Lachnospiraceae bacterium]|nr:flagellar hook-length control protein FliK [Lachnospiraceae bacterium]